MNPDTLRLFWRASKTLHLLATLMGVAGVWVMALRLLMWSLAMKIYVLVTGHAILAAIERATDTR